MLPIGSITIRLSVIGIDISHDLTLIARGNDRSLLIFFAHEPLTDFKRTFLSSLIHYFNVYLHLTPSV